MPAEALLLLVLIAVFIVGTWTEINLGIVALVAAWLAGGLILDMDAQEIISGFPDNVFVMLLGITFLLAVADLNGTVNWIVGKLVHHSGGNLALMVWSLFFIGLVISSFGTAAAPILFIGGLGFARRYELDPLLIGALCLHGCQAGLFSPIAPYGVLFSQLSAQLGIAINAWLLYGLVVSFHLLLVSTVFFLLGGRRLIGVRLSTGQLQKNRRDTESVSRERIATIVGLGGLLVGGSVFKVNIGFLAMGIALVLLLLSDKKLRLEVINKIAWPILLIITGILILVHVLETAETFTWVATQAESFGSTNLVTLLLAFLSAAITAVASTFGTFGILLPMAAPFVQSGELDGTALLSAIAISAAVTDLSPFSPWGALFLVTAADYDRQTLMMRMLKYTLGLMCIVPLIIWLVLVLPNW